VGTRAVKISSSVVALSVSLFFFFCVLFFLHIRVMLLESSWETDEEGRYLSPHTKTRGAHARENRRNESRRTTQRKRESRKEGKRENK
jgi:hypothetical protein